MKQSSASRRQSTSEEYRTKILETFGVSTRVASRLDTFVVYLDRWRKVTNIISDADFSNIWERHIVDSIQIFRHAPAARCWLDIGTGGGFPGLVIAMFLSERVGAAIHCVESDKRKCAFLRQVARAVDAPAFVHSGRIEEITPQMISPVDAVTARAVAPLPKLIELSKIWIDRNAIGVFPVGKLYGSTSLIKIPLTPNVEVEYHVCVTDSTSRIARVTRA
ncbi:MAG: 16S rRNA (guanine(527)-N(7))-methyltransferase RsmG [Steroidobacteraceae bacterium]